MHARFRFVGLRLLLASHWTLSRDTFCESRGVLFWTPTHLQSRQRVSCRRGRGDGKSPTANPKRREREPERYAPEKDPTRGSARHPQHRPTDRTTDGRAHGSSGPLRRGYGPPNIMRASPLRPSYLPAAQSGARRRTTTAIATSFDSGELGTDLVRTETISRRAF